MNGAVRCALGQVAVGQRHAGAAVGACGHQPLQEHAARVRRYIPVARHEIDPRLRRQVEAVDLDPAGIAARLQVVAVESGGGGLRRRRGQPVWEAVIGRLGQRHRPVWRGAAEADIGQVAAMRHLHAQQHVRGRGRHIVGNAPAHARGQRRHGVAERAQPGRQQRIEFKAVAAAPARDELVEDRIGLDPYWPAQQRIDVLERNAGQVRGQYDIQRFQRGRGRGGDAEARQPGIQLGCVQGHHDVRGSGAMRSVERFQRRQVKQFDAAILQPQQPARFQFAQRVVHGLARQAQHLRQLLLRDAHALRGLDLRQVAVAMRDRGQAPGDAGRRRQQLRFLDIVEGLARLGCQQLPEGLPPCRLLRQALLQAGARHMPQCRGADRARVVGARQAVEQADLAEPGAGLQQAEQRRLARFAAGVDLHGAAGDTIQAVETVAAGKERLAGHQPAQAAVIEQGLAQCGRQLAEPGAGTYGSKRIVARRHRARQDAGELRLRALRRARQSHAGLLSYGVVPGVSRDTQGHAATVRTVKNLTDRTVHAHYYKSTSRPPRSGRRPLRRRARTLAHYKETPP
ncbi:hypothetical protein CNECB9_1980003 [Cupriavidus necator]|uniref:Uncharacterized protein n=1 Tax=Cupriavidus necator TaxID=106590 RepID=A0A1K0IBS3_CUPNE|nr:hypothetical protein CNECB9_1980003 [Cupriavidus necator]